MLQTTLTTCLSAVLSPLPDPAPATPTVVEPMFLSEMGRDAELIVTGTVARQASRWNDARTTIHTDVTFRDLRVYKGAVDTGELTLRLGGGWVGDDRIVVVGMPHFRTDARYLLFVTGNGRDISPIVGFHQGCFEVVRDGTRSALRTVAGDEVAGVRDDRLVVVPGPKLAPRTRAPAAALSDAQERILQRARAARPAAEPARRTPHDATPIVIPRNRDDGTRIGEAELAREALRAGRSR